MIRRLFHLRHTGPSVSEGVEWEIQHHLEERVDELMREGRSRAESEQEAARSFGDVERVRRELRGLDRRRAQRVRLGALLETMWQDVRYGIRGMGRDPLFTGAVVLTLGLGVGVNAALFGVIDALLLRPLPYAQPGELHDVFVTSNTMTFGRPHIEWPIASEVHKRAAFGGGHFLHSRRDALYTGGVEPLSAPTQGVSPGFHKTLGVWPVLGRGLLEEDARPNAPDVVLLDHAFWTEQFGQDPRVIGRVIQISDVGYEVIGVMPPRFKYPEYSFTSFWVPLRTDGTMMGRAQSSVHMVARISDAESAVAKGSLASLGTALFAEAGAKENETLTLVPVGENRARNQDIKRAIWMLSGAVLFILLVAGANMMNLLLVRASGRTRELAIRFALGASRVRVFRQMMTETIIIALLSGSFAALLAFLALTGVRGITPDEITFFAPYDIEVERRTLTFTFMLAALSGLVFGLVPALRAVRMSVPASDAALTSYATRARSSRRLRRSLVIGEVALAVPLLTAAVLLSQSFVRLIGVEPGFDPDRLAMINLTISGRYRTPAERTAYVQRLEQRLEQIPGVTGATFSYGLPPHTSFSFGVKLQAEGAQPPAQGQPELLPFASVRPDFFDVTGATILTGRPFTVSDGIHQTSVIIDRDLADFLWSDGNAVGRRFRLDDDAPWLTVVGIMSDMKLMGPNDRNSRFAMLYPMKHDDVGGYLSFAVGTASDPTPLLQEMRKAIRSVDSSQPIVDIGTATHFYAESVAMPRFLLVLMGVLGALGLTLAAVGIYAVLAFGVAQRRHELAVRMALGARAGHVRGMVVGEGLALAALGAALGIAGSVFLTRVIRGALFEIEPNDPSTLALVVITMLVVAAIASFRPAQRATALDPLAVMRSN